MNAASNGTDARKCQLHWSVAFVPWFREMGTVGMDCSRSRRTSSSSKPGCDPVLIRINTHEYSIFLRTSSSYYQRKCRNTTPHITAAKFVSLIRSGTKISCRMIRRGIPDSLRQAQMFFLFCRGVGRSIHFRKQPPAVARLFCCRANLHTVCD